MRIHIGLELNCEDRVLAWALDFPGCFAYGADGSEAVINLARELVAYEQWVNSHAGKELIQLGDFDLRVVDTWEVYTINDQYELEEGGYAVNAWFKHDWKPLQTSDVERGLDLLRWSREDLLNVVQGLNDEQMTRKLPGERWSIRGILKHVGSAEWWYLNRLRLVTGVREDLPDDPFERLQQVRQRLEAVLPELVGKDLVLGKDGEFWSPRKMLRRAIWHEIDHRQHILKLLP
ncbi:MAG: DinB family protein [Chloroflexi bacterium]|nr:DinB family protein [Chloroflexota bacterium]